MIPVRKWGTRMCTHTCTHEQIHEGRWAALACIPQFLLCIRSSGTKGIWREEIKEELI